MRNKLTALQVKRAPSGKLQDGGGLILVKRDEAGKWVYRYSHLGKRREMGLGRWPHVGLAAARTCRDHWAAELAAGRDPLEVSHEHKAAEKTERDRVDPIFVDMCDAVLVARKATLRGGGTRGRWLSPLTLHVIPKIGRKPMSKITTQDIVDAIRPIWHEKHPTAKKAIERTRIVFSDARLMGFECDPFTVDAAKRQLGAVLYSPEPMASTPWQDMPALFRALDTSLVSHACLRWMMLTVARMEACRAASVSEVEDGIWTIPADRVKGREGRVKSFRVPLSEPARKFVADQGRYGDILFAGPRGRPISNAAVEKAMRETGVFGKPHGFRASFRTWAQDHDVSWDVSETVLGHVIGGRVERSYARSDLLDRRRPVMEQWGAHLCG